LATALPLRERTLMAHSNRVAIPTYDRSALTPAIVHIGVGSFHRAHQAVYFDELAERRVTSGWGIVGAGLRRRAMKEALAPQGGLYTVIERGAERDTARVIGAIRRLLFAPDDPEAMLSALADPQTRLVTLTITGDGYHVDPSTLAFDDSAPEIRADLGRPARPRTMPGYLAEALRRRRRAGTAPFTVLSCDNVPANGSVARASVVSHARLHDESLARWIEDNVAFPSSIVDRITPGTTEATHALVRRFGIADRWPVPTEPYSQWIIEDSFSDGRPPLEEVGVRFVTDLGPFELAKKRLLNGGHSALAYLGYLAGHRRTDEALAEPVFHEFLETLMRNEVAPLLAEVPGLDLDDYRDTLLERLANPGIADELERLCARGSTKMPAYLLPSIVEARERRRSHELLTLAVAGWFRYLRGTDMAGERIEVTDPLKERLQRLAIIGGEDPRGLLSETSVFGVLGRQPGFIADLELALEALDRDGPAAVIEDRLRSSVALAA